MDRDIKAAAIERLEAEKRRRLDEKVARGEAVRMPLSLVVHDPGQVAAEIESVKATKLAELRQAGETREVVWDEPLAIVTGVPRSPDWGKDWAPLPPAKPYDRYAVASDEPPKPAMVRPSEEYRSRRRPKTIRAPLSREATRLPRTASFASLTRIKICSAPSASSLVKTPRAWLGSFCGRSRATDLIAGSNIRIWGLCSERGRPSKAL
jgi:hypothetical protein